MLLFLSKCHFCIIMFYICVEKTIIIIRFLRLLVFCVNILLVFANILMTLKFKILFLSR